jgi:multisubunit Na+/H+ antiporter MnhB subunit
MKGRQAHDAATRLMSVVMIGLGIALLVSTLTRGGGALAVGVIFGVLFVAAGSARLYMQLRQRQ